MLYGKNQHKTLIFLTYLLSLIFEERVHDALASMFVFLQLEYHIMIHIWTFYLVGHNSLEHIRPLSISLVQKKFLDIPNGLLSLLSHNNKK